MRSPSKSLKNKMLDETCLDETLGQIQGRQVGFFDVNWSQMGSGGNVFAKGKSGENKNLR